MKRFLAQCIITISIVIVNACSKEAINTIKPAIVDKGNLIDAGSSTTMPLYYSSDDSNMLLGDPDDAQPNAVHTEKYLITNPYYAESYNNTTHCPNWTSWHLDAANMGNIKRKNNFRAYDNLPQTWYAVHEGSYSGSGFDRGHNCPSGDRTNSSEANSSTFLMTNMIPQAPQNNQLTWEHLESYTRSLIQAGNEAYIIMGAYGRGGTGKNGYMETINDGRAQITVPKRIWKVIVIIPNGTNDLNRINKNTRIITIDTPNDDTVDPDWKKYITTIQAIEAATGYHLLSNLPASMRAILANKIDHI